MAWLMRGSEVLASVELAERRRDRARGLLGRDGLEGALLLRPARSVHSFGMRFDLDIAYCDGDLVVLQTRPLDRNRLALPVRGARCVLEAERGAFADWHLRPGDALYLKVEA